MTLNIITPTFLFLIVACNAEWVRYTQYDKDTTPENECVGSIIRQAVYQLDDGVCVPSYGCSEYEILECGGDTGEYTFTWAGEREFPYYLDVSCLTQIGTMRTVDAICPTDGSCCEYEPGEYAKATCDGDDYYACVCFSRNCDSESCICSDTDACVSVVYEWVGGSRANKYYEYNACGNDDDVQSSDTDTEDSDSDDDRSEDVGGCSTVNVFFGVMVFGVVVAMMMI